MNSRLEMMRQLYNRYATDTVITMPHILSSSHQLLVEDMVDAIRSPQQQLNLSRKSSDGFNSPMGHKNPHQFHKTITVQALPYKSLSQIAHDFGIIPSLLKEGEYFCQFEEVTLWCKTDLHLMTSALSPDLLNRCTLFQEEVEWRNALMKIREQLQKSAPIAGSSSNLNSSTGSGGAGLSKGVSLSHGPSQFPNPHVQQVLGFASFVIFLSTIALQVIEQNELVT